MASVTGWRAEIHNSGSLIAAATITGSSAVNTASGGTFTATITGGGILGRVGAGSFTATATITATLSTAPIYGSGSRTATATITGAGVVGSFVTRDASTGNLMLDGQRFRFGGVNAYAVGYNGATPGYAYGAAVDSAGMHYASHSEIDAVLYGATTMNARVIRAWGPVLNVGRVGSIQPTIGTFQAAALEPVDYFLQRCNALGIKVIFPLVDNYDFGPRGIDWYVANTGGGAKSNFWTRTTPTTGTIERFEAHITYVLNHVNQYTGIAYKNDPAVLAWESGNEISADGTVSAADWITWTSRIAAHIKTTLGAKQLFFDGVYGITYSEDDDYLSIPLVDGYSDHTYDNTRDPNYESDEGARVHAFGKAFFIGEHPIYQQGPGATAIDWTLTSFLSRVKGCNEIDGSLAWALGAPLHDQDQFSIVVPGTTAAMRRGIDMLAAHSADMAARALPLPQVVTGGAEFSGAGSVNRFAYVSTNLWSPEKNDLVVLFGSATSVATVAAAPAGWTNPLGAGGNVSSDSNTMAVMYHWVTSAEQIAGTSQWTVPMFTTAKTGECYAVVLRGIDTNSPVDAFNTSFSSADTATPHVLPSLTGLSDNSIALASTVSNSPTYSTDPETQWSLIGKSATIQGQWTGVANSLTTAGGTVTAANITPSAGDEYASISIAFNAAPLLTETAIAPPNNVTVAMGDSITAAGSAYDYQPWLGSIYLNQLHILTRQRMRYGGVYATGGWTMTQIRDVHLPEVLALNPRPGAAILLLGTNDQGNYIFTNQATLRDIVRQLLAVGIAPILATIMPRDDNPTSTPGAINWSVWIRQYAARNGFSVMDAWEAVTDPDDTYKTGYSADGMHPKPIAHKAIADQGITDGLPSIFPATPTGLTSTSATDTTTLFHDGTTNRGLFASDSNADGVADGFTKAGTGTVSLVTPSGGDGLAGNWQQVQGGAGSAVSVSRVITGWTAGKTYRLSARIQTENFIASGGSFYLDVEAAVPGGFLTPDGTSLTLAKIGIIQWFADTEGLLNVEFTIPTGTTTLTFYGWIDSITSGTPPKLRIGELTLRRADSTSVPSIITATITGGGVVARFGSGSRTTTATITGSSGNFGGSGTRTTTATITGAGSVSTATFLTDTFTHATDVVLASHTGEVGATWTQQPGTSGVPNTTGSPNNRLYCGALEGHYYASGTPSSANYTVTATIVVASNLCYLGVGARMNTAANSGYFAYVWNNSGTTDKIMLDRYNAGAVTNLGNPTITTPTVGTTHTLDLVVSGTSISVYWDGVLTIGPVTDSTFSAAGKAGIIEGGSASPFTTVGFQMDSITAT